MKILLSSHLFHPSIGGIESISMLLAESFQQRGHEVRVITQTPSEEREEYPFKVYRLPSHKVSLECINWCDILFHSNITLRNIWPLTILQKRWVITHQTWIARGDGSLMWMDRVKRLLLNAAKCISISKAVAQSMPTHSVIIPNSYDDKVFRLKPEIPRVLDLVFMGRLVSDKGADILLDAVSMLKSYNLTPSITIIGGGPEMEALQAQAARIGISEMVRFTGPLRGEDLCNELNRHKIMVIPSLWNEPFGIVALEGLACGCITVGSNGGGLKDAIGKCGATFDNGNIIQLAGILRELLTNSAKLESYKKHVSAHLRRHEPKNIINKYLEAFNLALESQNKII